MEHTFVKHFTPLEANRTLPLVRRIVADILDASHELHALAAMLGNDAAEHPQIQAMNERMRTFFNELEELGCFYKDWGFSIGLVDFPAIIGGDEVFLCWRSDEEAITWYHGIDAGYAGRRRIPQTELAK